MKVEILSRKLVKPSTSTVTSQTPNPHEIFKISFFDQLLAPVYVPFILYYTNNDHDTTSHDQKSTKLQKSLSEILTNFYPLAGRYNRNNLSIECSNQGVEFLEAKVINCNLSELLNRDVNNYIEFLDNLFYKPHESETSPLITIQFNVFECGGVAVGVTMAHRLADTFTMSKFMEGWATACRVGLDEAPRPNFPFTSICPTMDISFMDLGAASFTKEAVSKIVTRRFLFSGEALSNLKDQVIKSANSGRDQSITRVKVIFALIWRVLIKVGKARRGHYIPSIFAFPVNMRTRTSLLLPENPCGNFASLALTQFEPNNTNDKPANQEEEEGVDIDLYSLVCKINDAMNAKFTDIAKATKPEDFLRIDSSFYEKLKEAGSKNSELVMYAISSWCGITLNVDFGWGLADWVSNVCVPADGVMYLMDNRDGGIEAWLNLNQDDMVLFLQDEEIVTFTSQ